MTRALGDMPDSSLVFARIVFLGRVLVIGAVRYALLTCWRLPSLVRTTITSRLVTVLLGDVGFRVRIFRIHAEGRAICMPRGT